MEVSREVIRQIIQPIRAELNRGESGARRGRKEKGSVSKDSLPVQVDREKGCGAGLVGALQVGYYSRYAGGMLLNVFVAQLMEGVFPAGFLGGRFVLMVMAMVQFDAVNLERVKRLHRSEFGLLIGCEKSPVVATMRRQLTELVEGMEGQQAMVALARNYIEHLSPESSVFYVDDHFDPYWGKAEVLEGYSNLYHKAMEGMEHCFVHDSAGNPIFFSMRDAYHSFNEVLPYMAERLQGLLGKGCRLRLVFDRGGYDQKVFRELGRMGIGYAVWMKGDKTDYEELALEYEEGEFELGGNEEGKPRRVKIEMAEVALAGKWGMPVRKIVLRRVATRRLAKERQYLYSAFVTNDGEQPRREWVEAMILRWRQECDFKMQKAEFGLDQITTYRTKGYRAGAHEDIEEKSRSEVEGKVADNPELKPWRRQKQKLRSEIAKIDGELGKRTFSGQELDLRTVSEVALERRNRELLAGRKELASELAEVMERMQELPAKVNKLEVLKERDIQRFDFRKKVFMDMLRVTAHNARRMALKVLDKYYHNYRDQVDFLRRLIRSGGEVKLGGDGRITVQLSRLNTPSENQIATAFLDEINTLEPVLLGGDPIPIRFHLGP